MYLCIVKCVVSNILVNYFVFKKCNNQTRPTKKMNADNGLLDYFNKVTFARKTTQSQTIFLADENLTNISFSNPII